MNLSLFYENIQTFIASLQANSVISSIRELIPLVTAYRTTPDATTKSELDTAASAVATNIEKLIDETSKVPHSSYFVAAFKIDQVVSSETPQQLNSLIYSDIFTTENRLTELADSLQKIQDSFTNIINGLTSLNYEASKADEGHYIIGFEFGGDANIDNTKELEGYLKAIRLVLYDYACLSEKAAESNPPTIRTISKGSPLIIDLSWAQENLPTILMLVGATVLFYLSLKEKKVKITELEEQIKMEIPEKERTKLFERAFAAQQNKLWNDKIIEKHVDDLMKMVNSKPKDRGKQEKRNFLKKGVEELVYLLDQGIKVEVHEPAKPEEGDKDADKVESNSVTITRKYRQIEYKTRDLGVSAQLRIPKKTSEDEKKTK